MELLATIVYALTLPTPVTKKTSVIDFAGYPRYTSFTSTNSKMLKHNSSEPIAMSAKFLETQLPDSCQLELKHIIKSL